MKRRMGRIVGSAVLALGLVAGPAIAANADATSSYTNAGVLRAVASYTSSTNVLAVTDKANDGWGARAQYTLTIAPSVADTGYFDNTAGANQTRTTTISSLYQNISFRACSINNWVVVGCYSVPVVSGV